MSRISIRLGLRALALALLFALPACSGGGDSNEPDNDVGSGADGGPDETDGSPDDESQDGAVGETGGGDAADADAATCDPDSPICPEACGEEEHCGSDCTCQPNTLDSLFDGDAEYRVASSLACADVAGALRMRWEGRVPTSSMLPRSVFLLAADPFGGDRYEAANRYIRAVLFATTTARFEAALAVVDPDTMSRTEMEALVAAIFLRDTEIAPLDVAEELGTLCPELALDIHSKGEIPEVPTSRYGFFCPAPGIPDCGSPEPPPPSDCPPVGWDCADCPYLEMAEDALAALEEAYAALQGQRDAEGLADLIGVYLEAILETLATGQMPNPASIAVDLATLYLGEDYPGMTYIIDVMVNVAEGTLMGGPLVGIGMGVMAAVTGYGDMADQSSWNDRLADSRARVAAMRAYCIEINWAGRQAECRARVAEFLERRTAECAEAQASWELAMSNWEAENDACDADQAAAQRATDAAWSLTQYLRSGGWGYTRDAFELCCDMPYPLEEKCPPEEAGLERIEVPLWGRDPRGEYLLRSGGTETLRIPAFGPGSSGLIRFDPRAGLPGEPLSPPHAGGWDLIPIGGYAGSPGIDLEVDGLPDPITGEISLTVRPVFLDPIGPGTLDSFFDVFVEFDVATGGAREGTRLVAQLPTTIAFDDNRAEFHPLVATGSGVIDISAGGDFSAAVPWATLPTRPHDLVQLSDGRILASAGNGIFDVTGGGDFSTATPWATFPADASISGLEAGPGDALWATDLRGGRIFSVSGAGDYEDADAHARGLSYPVDTLWYDGALLVTENGRFRVVDATSGGDLSAAPAWVDLVDWGPQRLMHHPWRSVFVAAAAMDGSGAVFDITDPVAFVTSDPAITGIFNPAGVALSPDGSSWLVSEFQAAGSIAEMGTAALGDDLGAAVRPATGLRNPEGVLFAWIAP